MIIKQQLLRAYFKVPNKRGPGLFFLKKKSDPDFRYLKPAICHLWLASAIYTRGAIYARQRLRYYHYN